MKRILALAIVATNIFAFNNAYAGTGQIGSSNDGLPAGANIGSNRPDKTIQMGLNAIPLYVEQADLMTHWSAGIKEKNKYGDNRCAADSFSSSGFDMVRSNECVDIVARVGDSRREGYKARYCVGHLIKIPGGFLKVVSVIDRCFENHDLSHAGPYDGLSVFGGPLIRVEDESGRQFVTDNAHLATAARMNEERIIRQEGLCSVSELKFKLANRIARAASCADKKTQNAILETCEQLGGTAHLETLKKSRETLVAYEEFLNETLSARMEMRCDF